jgi:hypothetical protein
MATVFAHPRCMNCHTEELFPRQGDDEHRHTPNVARGPNDNGAAGLHCRTCHQEENQAASGVPGAPDWHLAPAPMAWQGLSAGDLCRALRDPARGAMPPDQLLAHFDTGLQLRRTLCSINSWFPRGIRSKLLTGTRRTSMALSSNRKKEGRTEGFFKAPAHRQGGRI